MPSVADLRTRQIEVMRSQILESPMETDLEDYVAVLDGVDDKHDYRSIALAAIKLFHHERGAVTDEAKIPDVSEPRSKGKARQRDGVERGPKGKSERKPKGNVGPGTGLIYVGFGRKAGMRPGDLVGAIANETDLTGREIGPIRISDNYSVVGVPEQAVDTVVKAIRATTIRGKKAKA